MSNLSPQQQPVLDPLLLADVPQRADCAASWERREIVNGLLYQYCRGIDRREWPTVAACFHDDAVDDHGTGLLRSPTELIEWLSKRHVHITSSFHIVMNVSFLLEQEDSIRTESLCMARQRSGENGKERQKEVGCRYLDLFERRDGRWAIAHRKVVFEWIEDKPLDGPGVPDGIINVSRRDRTDPIFDFLSQGV